MTWIYDDDERAIEMGLPIIWYEWHLSAREVSFLKILMMVPEAKNH